MISFKDTHDSKPACRYLVNEFGTAKPPKSARQRDAPRYRLPFVQLSAARHYGIRTRQDSRKRLVILTQCRVLEEMLEERGGKK